MDVEIKVSILLLASFVIILSGCMGNGGNNAGTSEDTEVIEGETGAVDDSVETVDTNTLDENEDFRESDDANNSDDFFGSLFGEMELPDNFPVDYLPIPDEGNVTGTNTMSFDGKTILVVEYSITSDEEEMKNIYEKHFTDLGFDVEYVSEVVQGDYTTVSMKEDNKVYVVQILDVGSGFINVSLTYQES